MKITKEEFEKLYDENISKKEYDSIINKIDERFGEIVKHIAKKHPNMWYDYGNCDYYSEDSGGYFDPEDYNEFIEVGGEWVNIPEPYNDSFPTSWLWEDFEEEFETEVKSYKEKKIKKKEAEKTKKQAKKAEKEKLIVQIKSKLSKEELKVIKFK